MVIRKKRGQDSQSQLFGVRNFRTFTILQYWCKVALTTTINNLEVSVEEILTASPIGGFRVIKKYSPIFIVTSSVAVKFASGIPFLAKQV